MSQNTEGWDEPPFKESILVDHKLAYIKRDKKYAEQAKNKLCIICNIINHDPNTPGFEICRNENYIIYLNLYPYTSSHVLISPIEHIEAYDEIPEPILMELSLITQRVIRAVKHFGNTDSFNVGWNQGMYAGGSIKHFHKHVVARYRGEMNFMEIIARTRPFIRSLEDTMNGLQRYGKYILGEESYEACISNLE